MVEDLIEDFVIEFGSDSDSDSDNDDRQLIVDAFCLTTTKETSTTCRNPRHDLTETLTQTFIIEYFNFSHWCVCFPFTYKTESLYLFVIGRAKRAHTSESQLRSDIYRIRICFGYGYVLNVQVIVSVLILKVIILR